MTKYMFNVIVLYTAYILGGIFGLHHFCRGKIFLGFLYLGTLGLLGLGLLFDLFAIPFYARNFT